MITLKAGSMVEREAQGQQECNQVPCKDFSIRCQIEEAAALLILSIICVFVCLFRAGWLLTIAALCIIWTNLLEF